MTNTYTASTKIASASVVENSMAGVAGLGLLATSTAILLSHVDNWQLMTVDDWLRPILVGTAAVAAVLTSRSIDRGNYRDAGHTGMFFLMASALIVFMTMGKMTEVRSTKVLTAEASQADRSRIEQQIAEAQENIDVARQKLVDNNCKPDSRRVVCQKAAASERVYKSSLKGDRSDLTATAIVPVDPQAENIAVATTLIMGENVARETWVKALVATFEPIFKALIIDFGAIAMLLRAFGSAPKVRIEDEQDDPPGKEEPEPVVESAKVTILKAYAERIANGEVVKQRDLAKALGYNESTVSRALNGRKRRA